MISRKKLETGNSKRKQQIALCGKLALEEAMDLSLGRLRDDGT
jgi:hypothetical protein